MPDRPHVSIRPLRAEDYPAVRAIFIEGIDFGDATFEVEAPTWEQWDAAHVASPRLVAEVAGAVIGWAALSPVSARHVYRGVAESSIYLAAAARGQGSGTKLLTALVAAADAAGFWTLQAGLFPENVASLRLHRRCGFRLLGYRERIGERNGRWRDVYRLERRRPE